MKADVRVSGLLAGARRRRPRLDRTARRTVEGQMPPLSRRVGPFAALLSFACCTTTSGTATHGTEVPVAQASTADPSAQRAPAGSAQADAPPPAASHDPSPDLVLLARAHFMENLWPRRCDRTSMRITCIVVEVPGRGKLHVPMSAPLPGDAFFHGCRPRGEVRVILEDRRARLRIKPPSPAGHGPCRAHTELTGYGVFGPVDAGTFEIVADAGEIDGVSFEPAEAE